MKKKFIAVGTLALLNAQVALGCMSDGAVDGALFSVPAGTFEVAVASYQAQQSGDLPRYQRNNLVSVEYMLNQTLNQNHTGQEFDVTLFEATGQHFLRIVGTTTGVQIFAHEVPKNEFESVIVSDIDVLTALVRKDITFAEADTLELFYQSQVSTQFHQLLTKTFI